MREISKASADGREMLSKPYVTVRASHPGHGRGVRGGVGWGWVCLHVCAHVLKYT